MSERPAFFNCFFPASNDPFKGYVDVLVIADVATGGIANPN